MRVPALIVLFCAFANAQPAFAQIFGALSDAPRSLALGRSDIADARDEWNPNPALHRDSLVRFQIPLSPLPLGLPQSFSAGLGADMPVAGTMLAGVALSRYQYADVFSWQSFGIQASRTFPVSGAGDSSRRAVAGLRIRYTQQTSGTEYLPFDDIGVDVGISFDLFPQLTLAAAVTHLVGLYNNQNIPIEDRTGWFGLSYRPAKELTIDAALESSSGYNAAIHIGAEYAIDPHLFIRAGTDTQTGEISGGVGVASGNVTADFSAVRHPDIGTSICFGVGLSL